MGPILQFHPPHTSFADRPKRWTYSAMSLRQGLSPPFKTNGQPLIVRETMAIRHFGTSRRKGSATPGPPVQEQRLVRGARLWMPEYGRALVSPFTGRSRFLGSMHPTADDEIFLLSFL